VAAAVPVDGFWYKFICVLCSQYKQLCFVLQVGREGDIQPLQVKPYPINQYSIVHERELQAHDTHALVKCVESLAFVVRDVAHITPYNFENCVRCIRTFVEASISCSKFQWLPKYYLNHTAQPQVTRRWQESPIRLGGIKK
jgi:hypothetical protein